MVIKTFLVLLSAAVMALVIGTVVDNLPELTGWVSLLVSFGLGVAGGCVVALVMDRLEV